MKSIKAKILSAMLGVGLFSSIVIGAAGSLLNLTTAEGILDKSMAETAKLAASQVRTEIERYKSIASEIGSISSLTDTENAVENCREIVSERISKYNLEACGVLNISGKDILSGVDCSKSEFFTSALSGKEFCSDFMVSVCFVYYFCNILCRVNKCVLGFKITVELSAQIFIIFYCIGVCFVI